MKKPFIILICLFLIACSSGGTSGGGGSKSQVVIMAGDSMVLFGSWKDMGIINDGVGTRRSWQLLQDLNGYLQVKPDKVFIMTGTADIVAYGDYSTADAVGQMVDKIKRILPNAKIFIISILPIRDDYFNLKATEINQRLQSLSGMTFINLYPLFQGHDDYYIWDGIHLTQTGYRAWTDAISGYVYA